MRCTRCYRRLLPRARCPGCGAEAPKAPREATPTPPAIRGYEDLSPLASGGFAWVYRAVRRQDLRPVALKVGRSGTDERCSREADALRKLGPPLVPELIDVGRTRDGRPWLALELLRGTSLAYRMSGAQNQGKFSLQETSRWLTSLVPVVERVHRAGLVHRDLKPENIFVRRRGAVVLLDFGLACAAGKRAAEDEWRSLTQEGEPLGTPLYMAPEQVAGTGECGPETDVYSLGVIAFELLAGRPPFIGDPSQVRQAQLSLAPPNLSEFAPVPSTLAEVIHRCLEKEASHRFHSAPELLESWKKACVRKKLGPHRAKHVPGAASMLRAETIAPLNRVLASVQEEGGKLSRIESGRYFFSFTGKDSELAATRAAARLAQLLEPSATVDALSPAIQRPVPSANEEEAQPRSTADAESQPLSDSAFIGRTELLAALTEDAHVASWRRLPLISTLTGEVGLGKSRVLTELRGRLSAEGIDVLQLSAPPERRTPDETTRKLLTALLGPVPPIDLEAVRRLMPQNSDSMSNAVAMCLGLLDERDGRAKHLQQVPGALREITAEAICKLLWERSRRGPTALLLDDAQWADPTCLDALEMAAIGEPGCSLWICVAVLPGFGAARPFWCDRAAQRRSHELSPLRSNESRALLVALLKSIEFVPERVLASLEEQARGSPLALEESVAALRRRGVIRRNEAGQDLMVAVEEMAHRSDLPVYERIARETLDLLVPRMRSFAQICSAVGVELSVEEVGQLARSLQSQDERIFAGARVDPRVGLSRLTRAGLLTQLRSDHFAFRHPRVKDAVEATAAQLVRETLHAALLALWSDRPASSERLSRIAEHAQRCGARREASLAYYQLADASRLNHRHVEAVQQYTQALHHLDRREHRQRYLTLLGRGKTRYRLQQFNEALDDLRGARALAEGFQQPSEMAEVLLEEATVLDWVEDWTGSSQCVTRAQRLIRRAQNPALYLRCELGLARALVRRQRYRRASQVLPKLVEQARRVEDYETEVISLLLLAFSLVHVDPPRAAERFEEVISTCQSAGDAMHLGGAYLNRVMLWIRLRQPDRAVQDLRQANSQARWLGHAQLERFASYNLAECLFWEGQLDEARGFALRAFELGVRFVGQHPSPLDALLLARIAHRSGDNKDARHWMDWIERVCPAEALDPNAKILHRAMQLVTGGDAIPASRESRTWRALIQKARVACGAEEQRELAAYASSAAMRIGVSQA